MGSIGSFTLADTVQMMNSSDYKERFRAEYHQLNIRLMKLCEMVQKWDEGSLDFTPTCPRATYYFQIKFMQEYLDILEIRAKIENIEL